MTAPKITPETGVSIGILVLVIGLAGYIVRGFASIETTQTGFGYELKAINVKLDGVVATLDDRPSRAEVIYWTEKLADTNRGKIDVPTFPRRP